MKRLIPILLLLASSVVHADKLQLKCLEEGGDPDMHSVIYVFHAAKLEVQLVSSDKRVNGIVEVSDDHYVFKFPKTESTWEKWVRINRWTGMFYREFGKPPFFKDWPTDGNMVAIGICEVSVAKKLF